MFHRIIHPRKKEDLLLELPEEFLDKEVEIQANEVNGKHAEEKSREERLKEYFEFLDTIKVDMKDFKFDRDEANER